MTDEKKSEIIKSIAFGVPHSEISVTEGVSVAEIQQIAYDYGDEIARKKEWYKKRYGGND